MNIKKYIVIVCFLLLSYSTSFGQNHQVAFTNVDLIVAYMPETKIIEQQKGSFQKKLDESLDSKRNDHYQKMQEFIAKEESGGWIGMEEKDRAIYELKKLESEIQNEVQKAQTAMEQKESELLKQLTDKIQKAINDVAIEKGYDYVLNNAAGGGIHTILVGKESNNITPDIARKLGINIE